MNIKEKFTQAAKAAKANGIAFWQIQAAGHGLAWPWEDKSGKVPLIRYGGEPERKPRRRTTKPKWGGFGPLTVPPERNTFLAIDVETTGLSHTGDRIIEFGFVAIVDGEVARTGSVLVAPGQMLPKVITKITGITDDMLSEAPVFSEVAPSIAAWLSKAPLIVAHNAKFDIDFISSELERAGLDVPGDLDYVCTLEESRAALEWGTLDTGDGKANLGAVAKALGIEQTAAHRAADDALVAAKILIELDRRRREHGEQKLV